jgi:dihydropteroate synthase
VKKTLPQIFGILNITPDSFSDGGQFLDLEKAVTQAQKLVNDGAHFIDVGGESTRPGAVTITFEEEWERIGIVITTLQEKFPDTLSLDTRRPAIAQKFLERGGTILNDVSGFQSPKMQLLAAQYQPLCIVNHFPGKNIEEVHEKSIDSIHQVRDELLKTAEEMIKSGIKPQKIVLDPGIGFGKTMELNQKLLSFAKEVSEYPVLIGHSKKRFLGQYRFTKEANLEAAQIALEAGTKYLRVHDVASHAQLIKKLEEN